MAAVPSSRASHMLHTRSYHTAGDGTGEKGEKSQLLLAGDPGDEPHRRGGEGLFLGSAFNLASAAIGLGILSLPYTVNNSGIILGSFLFFIMGLVTIYSLDVLITSAEMCGKITYQQTVKETFGETISMVVGGIIIWSASGSTISSFTIVADLMSPVFPDGNIMANRLFLMFLTLIILYPLCYLRKINSLRHASGAAIFAFFYMAGLVIILFFVQGKTKNKIEYIGHGVNIARSIPIIVYAYTCHTQAIPVYAELKNSTSKSMFYVILGGVFMSFFLYSSTGIFGYLTFGSDIKDNILLNYDHEHVEVLIGRIMICSAIILGYPMSTWVMRDSFEQIYFYIREKRSLAHKYDLEDAPAPLRREVSWRQNALETTVMLVVSVGIAILVPKINIVFGLVGSTSSVTLNFILPGLMYIKLSKRYPPKNPFSKLAKLRYIGAHVLIAFGLVIGIVGTTTTIINLV